MAKKVKAVIKLAAPGGAAAPGQKLGPVLGANGVNMMQFCTEFNAKTKDFAGMSVPVVLTVYDDRTFSMEFKKPPVYDLIKKELNLKMGSGKPNRDKVGKFSNVQAEKIATMKLPDLNTKKMDSAIKIVKGTARSMGLVVEE